MNQFYFCQLQCKTKLDFVFFSISSLQRLCSQMCSQEKKTIFIFPDRYKILIILLGWYPTSYEILVVSDPWNQILCSEPLKTTVYKIWTLNNLYVYSLTKNLMLFSFSPICQRLRILLILYQIKMYFSIYHILWS